MNLDVERERLRLAVANMSPSLSLVFADHQALIDAQASALSEMRGRVEAETIEKCAKVCDDRVQDHDNYTAADHEAEGCADAIRALGKGS